MKGYEKEVRRKKKKAGAHLKKKKKRVITWRKPQFDSGYMGKFIFLSQSLASEETLKSFIEQVVSNA